MKSIEIACCNLESVINANLGGAHRIELFENLPEGGCTPSYGMIKKAKEISNIPLYVMIRPRGGNFDYTESEVEIMREDILICKELRVDGIVFGILNGSEEVDAERCGELMRLWGGKSTFHRALDRTKCLDDAVRRIMDLGFERVLTSGGKETAAEGRDTLLDLHDKFGDRISIMAGSGIDPSNVHLFAALNEIHATCRKQRSGDGLFGNYSVSDPDLVRSLVHAAKQSSQGG